MASDIVGRVAGALSLPTDSEEQRAALSAITEALTAQPAAVSPIFGTIKTLLFDAKSGNLRVWTAGLLQLVLVKTSISLDIRHPFALECLDALQRLIADPNPGARPGGIECQKIALQCFAASYSIYFKEVAVARDAKLWAVVEQVKKAVMDLFHRGTMGQRTAAVKVLASVVRTQTKGSADPRLQRTAEPSLSLVRSGHPCLNVDALQTESSTLIEALITLLFTTSSAALLTATINSLTVLVLKVPPSEMAEKYAVLVVTALVNWGPTSTMSDANATEIRSAEKGVRLALLHLLRSPQIRSAKGLEAQINSFLNLQAGRMDLAAREEKERRDAEARRRREEINLGLSWAGGAGAGPSEPARKRQRLDADPATRGGAGGGGLNAFIQAASKTTGYPPQELSGGFDIQSLPEQAVIELVVESLRVVGADELGRKVASMKENLGPDAEEAVRPPGSDMLGGGPMALYGGIRPTFVPGGGAEEEVAPVNPLKADLGDEEDALDLLQDGAVAAPAAPAPEDDAAPVKVEANDELGDEAMHLDPAAAGASDEAQTSHEGELSSSARLTTLKLALDRICTSLDDGALPEIWGAVVSRFVTRGPASFSPEDMEGEASSEASEEQREKEGEELRSVIWEWCKEDLGARLEVVKVWLAEEWYAEQRSPRAGKLPEGRQAPYEVWVSRVLHEIEESDSVDRRTKQGFPALCADLPVLPRAEIERLGRMGAKGGARAQLGFTALRELVTLRPGPSRQGALDQLLSLSTHTNKMARNPAILMVKRWVPDMPTVASDVVAFAIKMLKRLEAVPPEVKEEAKEEDTEEMKLDEDSVEGQAAAAVAEAKKALEEKAVVESGEVVNDFPAPTTVNAVVQHVELLFSLCAKEPTLLDEILAVYPKLSDFMQKTIQSLITPLVKSLGAAHARVLAIVSECPPGAETLALRVLTILTQSSEPTPELLAAVQLGAKERGLDGRFFVPILKAFEDAVVLEQLPRLLGMLNGTPEMNATVKNVITTVVSHRPPLEVGGKERNPIMKPEVLMTYLHRRDKEIGLKQAREAIAICFAMPETFNTDVLRIFMQEIGDGDAIPMLFMRTVLQVNSQHKTMSNWIATVMLPRLIVKKVYNFPPLWEGFVIAIKALAPLSYQAVTQLPKEWMRTLVVKQPALKAPIIDYVQQKFGQRGAGIISVLEGESVQPVVVPPPSTGSGEGTPQPRSQSVAVEG